MKKADRLDPYHQKTEWYAHQAKALGETEINKYYQSEDSPKLENTNELIGLINGQDTDSGPLSEKDAIRGVNELIDNSKNKIKQLRDEIKLEKKKLDELQKVKNTLLEE